jgi:GNAT superfamily N-acetyltransferase
MNRHNIPDIDIRTKLAARGLECHLITHDPDTLDATAACKENQILMFDELNPLIAEAYERDDLTPIHFQYETWAVTLRQIEAPHSIVACSALSFHADLPCHFHTCFECVRPDHQRTGLGRLLYECITLWTRYLILNDVLVTEGIFQSRGDYCIVSFIDAPYPYEDENDAEDNEYGHGAFLKRLGFTRAQHQFGQDESTEIAFQLAFHVPLEASPSPESESP